MYTRTVLLAFLVLLFGVGTLTSCGGGEQAGSSTNTSTDAGDGASATPKPGMITPKDLTLEAVDGAMAEKGKTTYDVKCQACHSLGENRVVGPGWKGVTARREPHWIMNMVVNTDAMLADDPEAQKQLEECLVRMPNQGLSNTEAREVLEFMRQNDGTK